MWKQSKKKRFFPCGKNPKKKCFPYQKNQKKKKKQLEPKWNFEHEKNKFFNFQEISQKIYFFGAVI